MNRPRWSVVAGYAAVSGSNQMLWLTFAPLTTEAAAHYGVSVDAIGWLSELFPLLYVLLAIPAGLALDRWFRPALGLGVGLNAVGALVRVVSPGYPGVLVGQLMIAVAQPLLLAALPRVVEAAVSPPLRPRAIGIASAGLFAGMLVALVMGPLLGAGRIDALLAIQAALTLLSAIVMGVALARPIWPAAPPVRAGGVTAGSRLRAVLARPVIRSLVLVAGLGFGVFVAVTTWLQALLAPAGVSVDLAGIMLLAMVVAGIVAGVVLPDLVIRSGRAVPMLLGVVIVTVLACLVLALGPGPVTGMIAAIAYGLALLGALPVILSLVETAALEVGAGEAAATATGLVWLAGNLGGIVVSLLVQAVLGRPSLAFALMALLMLVGLPVLLALRRRLPLPSGDVTGAASPKTVR